MSITTLRPRTQIILAVVAPLCCIALGIFLIWPPASRLRSVREELTTTKQTIEQKQVLIEQAEAAAQGRPLALAVAVRGEQEPIVFLRQLAALTADTGATLVGVRVTKLPPVAAPRTGTGNAKRGSKSGQKGAGSPPPTAVGGQRPVLPATVSELTDEVTVEGTFNAILSLLVRLETFERILSVSRCRITSGGGVRYPRLRAVFTLSRFTARPGPPSPPPAEQPTAER